MSAQGNSSCSLSTYPCPISKRARTRIAGLVRRTPAFESADVSARLGRRTILKLEALQIAGSFKVRGVFNKVLGLTEAKHARAW